MKTALYAHHSSLHAKMINFGAFEMPLQYEGIIHEHNTVRKKVGIFDVSHMGRIEVSGLGAQSLLDYLSTNNVAALKDGSCIYTVWCDESGKSIDDVIIYRLSSDRFFVVANAGNKEKDLEHLLHYSVGRDVIINERFNEEGILALQGPLAMDLLLQIFPDAEALEHMSVYSDSFNHQIVYISTTGYTGSPGFEIFASNEIIVLLWDLLIEKGKEFGIEPIGLGARDTLRLEMGYALYGHELNENIAPTESVSCWTVKFDKPDFLGKKALKNLEGSTFKRRAYGIILEGKKIAREGYLVFHKGNQVGYVTSGTFSPSLNQSIALVLVEKKFQIGDSVEVQIRGGLCLAHIVKLPFVSISNS